MGFHTQDLNRRTAASEMARAATRIDLVSSNDAKALRDQVVTGQYVSEANPNSVLATLDAIVVRAGIHLIWCDGRRGMADQLESLVRQFIRGIEKDITRLGRAK